MTPNPGHLPADCVVFDADGHEIGTRAVHVVLFNGWDSRKASGGFPWPSASVVWSISRPPHPFEIKQYEVVT